MKRKRNIFKILLNLIFFALIILVIVYNEEISTYIIDNYIYNKNATIEIEKNNYSLNKNYEFVQITDDFVAKNYQHLLNIIYTILDSGVEEFYFYCDEDYRSCLADIDTLIPNVKDSSTYDVLADINNLVHPYNSYQKLTVVMNNYGKVLIKVKKQYSEDDITFINNEIDNIVQKNIKEDLTTEDKIKTFHDYIINNTKYDKERANNMSDEEYENSESHTATGLLKNHIALCGGYSDIMSIYMTKLGVQNIRISADKHVWNLVRINDKWLHLDATWDDPVTNTGSQIIIHDYFLIDTKQLLKADTHEHNYNQNFYREAKVSS